MQRFYFSGVYFLFFPLFSCSSRLLPLSQLIFSLQTQTNHQSPFFLSYRDQKGFFGASAKTELLQKIFSYPEWIEKSFQKICFHRKKRSTKCLRADKLLQQLEGDLPTCNPGFGTSLRISRLHFASCSSRFSRIVLTDKTCRTDLWRACRRWDAPSISSSITRSASCSRKRYYFTLCFHLLVGVAVLIFAMKAHTQASFTPSPAPCAREGGVIMCLASYWIFLGVVRRGTYLPRPSQLLTHARSPHGSQQALSKTSG